MAGMTELYRRRFPATPQSVPLARHDVVDAVTHAGLTDARARAALALAVTEALSNAVRHAYPPSVRTDMSRSRSRVAMTV
jgi:anti-sigma regulatory factor (Ser/Thr protein kinase)